jgi:hypothetical protein
VKTILSVLLLVLISLLAWVSFRPPVPHVVTHESSTTPGKPDQAPDGFSGFEYTIKDRLRDPDSFKFYGATQFKTITLNHTQAWLTRVDYGAKNGFGGYDRQYGFIVVTNGNGRFYTPDEFHLAGGKP